MYLADALVRNSNSPVPRCPVAVVFVVDSDAWTFNPGYDARCGMDAGVSSSPHGRSRSLRAGATYPVPTTMYHSKLASKWTGTNA
jgi:hypothetical protein